MVPLRICTDCQFESRTFERKCGRCQSKMFLEIVRLYLECNIVSESVIVEQDIFMFDGGMGCFQVYERRFKALLSF